MGAAGVPFCCDSCEFWVLGTVWDAAGGLGFGGPDAVVGGVEIPFAMCSGAGEAMVRGAAAGSGCAKVKEGVSVQVTHERGGRADLR